MPCAPLRRNQQRKTTWPWNAGGCVAFNAMRQCARTAVAAAACQASCAARRLRESGGGRVLVVPVAQRVDVDEHAVLEPQPAHELAGAEVVDPDLDGNLDQALADRHGPAADPHDRSAQNGATPVDLGGVAAVGDHFGTVVAFGDQMAAATERVCRGCGGESEPERR